MPCPDRNKPLVTLPEFGHDRPDRQERVRAEGLPGHRIHRLAVGARARIRTVGTPGHVQQRRRRRRPFVRQEVGGLAELVVLRLLVHEPHAVVERQPAVHLPVVLDVALGVVVDEDALDVLGRLVVGAEDAERGVG